MNKIIVGKIVNTHGIKGELKVQKTNDEAFNRGNAFYIDGFECPVYIDYARNKPNLSYIKIKGLDNINDVLKYKNKYIRVLEKDLYTLNEGEYFIKDLIDLDVYDTDDNLIGKIVDVENYEVNDLYIISTEDGQKTVPAVKEFIKKIDLKNKKVIINFIEGM